MLTPNESLCEEISKIEPIGKSASIYRKSQSGPKKNLRRIFKNQLNKFEN